MSLGIKFIQEAVAQLTQAYNASTVVKDGGAVSNESFEYDDLPRHSPHYPSSVSTVIDTWEMDGFQSCILRFSGNNLCSFEVEGSPDKFQWEPVTVTKISNDGSYPVVPTVFKPPYVNGICYGANKIYPYMRVVRMIATVSEVRARVTVVRSKDLLDLSVRSLSDYPDATLHFKPSTPVTSAAIIEVAPLSDADGTVRSSYCWGMASIELENTTATASEVRLINTSGTLLWSATVKANSVYVKDYKFFKRFDPGSLSQVRIQVMTANVSILPDIQLVKLHV